MWPIRMPEKRLLKTAGWYSRNPTTERLPEHTHAARTPTSRTPQTELSFPKQISVYLYRSSAYVFFLLWDQVRSHQADQGHTSAQTALCGAQANRRPTKDVSKHDQSRPWTTPRIVSLRPRTMDRMNVSNQLAQDRWVWSASVRNAVISIGDTVSSTNNTS